MARIGQKRCVFFSALHQGHVSARAPHGEATIYFLINTQVIQTFHTAAFLPPYSSPLARVLSRWTTDSILRFFFFTKGRTCDIWKFLGEESNQRCSCQPTPQPQQRQIQIPGLSVTYITAHGNARSFNPLSEARDQTCILMDTS